MWVCASIPFGWVSAFNALNALRIWLFFYGFFLLLHAIAHGDSFQRTRSSKATVCFLCRLKWKCNGIFSFTSFVDSPLDFAKAEFQTKSFEPYQIILRRKIRNIYNCICLEIWEHKEILLVAHVFHCHLFFC